MNEHKSDLNSKSDLHLINLLSNKENFSEDLVIEAEKEAQIRGFNLMDEKIIRNKFRPIIRKIRKDGNTNPREMMDFIMSKGISREHAFDLLATFAKKNKKDQIVATEISQRSPFIDTLGFLIGLFVIYQILMFLMK